ncbi:MAG: NADH-quinone oxidoreductase subunit M [Armatimonadetes bacterium]|nr:NADH-quinone oxidoreductase subunit M [Armatimonadota bacterium]
MNATGFGLLSAMTFLPMLGVILLLIWPAEDVKAIRGVTLVTTFITFILSLFVLIRFTGNTYHFQLLEQVPWMPQMGINYKVGVDGISIWLILLTTFLSFISVLFSSYVKTRVKQYMAFMLLLETTMLGVFISLDLILFYAFFEASLIPMFFLINIWGGERRTYAAVKFFIFTFAGSIFMLVGIIALSQIYRAQFGSLTFDIVKIQSAIAQGSFWVNFVQWQVWIFWAFALAFLVKCPMVPFHTWLPDAHVEAPTAGSVILAGVLLKMGTYGFLRFVLPFFPDVIKDQVLPIMILAVIGIIYGAVVAAVQVDVKKLVAYSSVAHMGFVMLGIFSLTHNGLMGGAMQQLNHGISTGALFLLIGLLYERIHTRMFKDLGGLKAQMPIYAAIFLIVMLSSVGLPTTNGFIGEFLAMLGAFEAAFAGAYGLNIGLSVIAGFGVVLAAVYLLVMFMRTFYGPNENPTNQKLRDLKPWEIVMASSFVLFIFWAGLYPNTFLAPMEKSIGAVRMMAINPVGQRPNWDDVQTEIDADGNLVKVAVRDSFASYTSTELIAPANLHFPAPAPVASRPEVIARR